MSVHHVEDKLHTIFYFRGVFFNSKVLFSIAVAFFNSRVLFIKFFPWYLLQLSNVDKRAMVKRHSLFPEKFKLQKVSQRLFVQHDIEKFNKAFSVKLDLESFRDTDAGPLEPVAILWNDGEPTIKSKAECSLSQEANRVVMTMKNFPNRSG